ncbi:hypothetical protein [Gramella sp. KN1008]|uniref:hypothetical protein n=1 Tax=Gramella sp. KN1008 TaxID=2529298 RepID=UPI001040B0BB|nr:hypothetical protein [Gramella sp. KN1008]TBW27613.1 hypothetical protein EZJ28_11620 [Gramella sp. KN1008]
MRRIYITAFKEEKIVGILTIKHKVPEKKILLVYLGMMIVHPDHGRVVTKMASEHISILNKIKDQSIYIYSITTNPFVHKIISKFYQNIFPRSIDQKELLVPEFYSKITSHSGYNICEYNPYKIINSPSIARYNQEFKRKLSEIPASKNSLCQSYNLNTENGDRVLIIGTYNNQNP